MIKTLSLVVCALLAAPASAFFRKIGGSNQCIKLSWPKNRDGRGARVEWWLLKRTVDSP